jgi:hypothetical protein
MTEHSHNSDKSTHTQTHRNKPPSSGGTPGYQARLAISQEVCRTVNPLAAMVYQEIDATDQGEGVYLIHDQLARTLGKSADTIKRTIRELEVAGWIKARKTQRGNCYKIVTRFLPGQKCPSREKPVGSTPPSVISSESSSSTEGSLPSPPSISSSTPSSLGSSLVDGVLPPGSQSARGGRGEEGVFPSGSEGDGGREVGEGLSGSQAHRDNPCLAPGWAEGPSGWPVPPIATGKRIGLLSPEIWAFTAYFEALVTPLAKRRITDEKREKWLWSACRLLVMDSRPFKELVSLTTWIFRDCDGHLPFENRWGGYNEKVTRVAQIRDNYDKALAYMRSGCRTASIRGNKRGADYGQQ